MIDPKQHTIRFERYSGQDASKSLIYVLENCHKLGMSHEDVMNFAAPIEKRNKDE